jgi:hypothetical protein
VARILIVEGASRGLRLAGALVADGHAVRIVTSDPERRSEIERIGGEYFPGTPARLGTLRGALEHVTIACWLLAHVDGGTELVAALHGSRLQQFLGDAIDSTLRGFLYEAGGTEVPVAVLVEGERIASETTARNLIPMAILRADPNLPDKWLAQARGAVDGLLEARSTGV